MAAVLPEIDQKRIILTWIGFNEQANRASITNDASINYADMQTLKEKDITNLSNSFGRRTEKNGKIDFGIRRTKKLKFMLHWTQDFARISKVPTIIGLTESQFLVEINTTGERTDVRKLLREQSDAKAKVASPGPLV